MTQFEERDAETPARPSLLPSDRPEFELVGILSRGECDTLGVDVVMVHTEVHRCSGPRGCGALVGDREQHAAWHEAGR